MKREHLRLRRCARNDELNINVKEIFNKNLNRFLNFFWN